MGGGGLWFAVGLFSEIVGGVGGGVGGEAGGGGGGGGGRVSTEDSTLTARAFSGGCSGTGHPPLVPTHHHHHNRHNLRE